MSSPPSTEGRPFSDELEEWLVSDAPKTLGSLEAVFAEKSFAVAIMLLMLPSATPLPTGGVTHILEAVTVLLSLQMILGRRTIWLPNRWRNRALGESATGKAIPWIIRRIRWFERFSRPRWRRLFDQRWFARGIGVLFLVFTIGAIVAPPFSGLDTLPSLGIVIIALAMLLEDIVLVGIGTVIGTSGITLILTVGSAIARLLRELF